MITFDADGRAAHVNCDQCGKTAEVYAVKMMFARLPDGWMVSVDGYQTCGTICAHLVADKKHAVERHHRHIAGRP
jgi:hypothetical protein